MLKRAMNKRAAWSEQHQEALCSRLFTPWDSQGFESSPEVKKPLYLFPWLFQHFTERYFSLNTSRIWGSAEGRQPWSPLSLSFARWRRWDSQHKDRANGRPRWLSGKESTWQSRGSLGWEDPQRRKWQPTPVFLPRESHGQRSLAAYHLWGHKQSDMT